MNKVNIPLGQKFNLLSVLSFAGMIKTASGKYATLVNCYCDCGNIKTLKLTVVKNGVTRSCGCITEKLRVKAITTHGNTGHPLYKVWAGIKSRCFCKTDSAFKYYGGRGITMCKEWANSSDLFIKWALRNGWSKGLDLDRENGNGNYEPCNCRFITHAENMRNKRPTSLSSYESFQLKKYESILSESKSIYDEDDIMQDI